MITNIITSFFSYLIILVVYLAIVVGLRKLFKIPKFIFRKILHLVAVFTPVLLLYLTDDWLTTDIILAIFGVGAYLILMSLEHKKEYSVFLAEKNEGEVRQSLIEYILMCLAVVTVCYGLFDRPYVAIVSFLMWGLGDAAAAIAGKYFGKKHLSFRGADTKKTVFGTVTMFIVSFIVGIGIIYYLSNLTPATIGIILGASIVGTYLEAISHNGMDTITVPSGIALTVLVLMLLFNG